ncbi:glycosyltransferase family 2 protein [Chromohalobacter salexigens]|nr:glycosyltransferase family 2 protein [Chromohalobacter salexigens]
MENKDRHEHLVSVIIPNFNRWPHICDAIDSVIGQTYQNVECIVVDDASTDGSPEKIADKYRHNPEINIEKLYTNTGQSRARNHGAQIAKGKLVCFLDSDDILPTSSIEDRVSVFNEEQGFNGISFGENQVNDKPSTRSSKKEKLEHLTLDEYLDDRGWLHTNAFMMPTAEFKNLGGFNENLRQREDIEFFIRSLCHLPAKYCGTTVSSMRAVDKHRARHDYEKIIAQGHGFYHALSCNTTLHDKASPKVLNSTLRRSLDSYLNALYKTKNYKEYRKEITFLVANRTISPSRKQMKRYLVSFIKY